MKYFGLIFLSISCGKIHLQGDYNFVGTQELKSVEYQSTSSEFQNIKKICDSLKVKEDVKSNYVTGSGFTYQNSIKVCEMTKIEEVSQSKVTVEDAGQHFYLRENSSYYTFKDFELFSAGSLAQICQQVQNGRLQSPISFDNQNFIFFTSQDIQTTDCYSNNESQCVKITKSTRVSDTQVRNQSVEWIRFKTKNPSQGIWDYRQIVQPTGCEDGQYYLRRASLR